MKKIIIIGAGPIGLETALYAQNLGFDINIIEKGNIGENLQKWSHVTLFSPFYMNSSELGRTIAKPDLTNDECCTGQKYIDNYLKPIAEHLKDKITLNTEVLSISKNNILKGEQISSPSRTKKNFIVLVKNSEKEYLIESNIVIDCSGVYDNPLNFGKGGLKIANQSYFEDNITNYIPDLLGKDKNAYIGKTTLLIGTGYSSATTALLFKNLIDENNSTKLFWLSRSTKEKPFIEIENDILKSRQSLIENSNNIALGKVQNIDFINNSFIENLEKEKSQIKVSYNQNDQIKNIVVDNIISNVGYKPNNSIYSELQVHECYASQGIMKLASTLLSSTSADCLNQTSSGVDTLKNPEPDFFIIGSKSYGRNSNFILKVGYEQIKDIFDNLKS